MGYRAINKIIDGNNDVISQNALFHLREWLSEIGIKNKRALERVQNSFPNGFLIQNFQKDAYLKLCPIEYENRNAYEPVTQSFDYLLWKNIPNDAHKRNAEYLVDS